MREFWKVKLPVWNRPGWMEFYGGWLCNSYGSGFPWREGAGEVLEKVQAEGWNALDWRGTCFDDPQATEGWLAPDGYFWGCSYMTHEQAAVLALKLPGGVDEACQNGYARIHGHSVIDGKPFYVVGEGVKLTAAQVEWLTAHGYEVHPWHVEGQEG